MYLKPWRKILHWSIEDDVWPYPSNRAEDLLRGAQPTPCLPLGVVFQVGCSQFRLQAFIVGLSLSSVWRPAE